MADTTNGDREHVARKGAYSVAKDAKIYDVYGTVLPPYYKPHSEGCDLFVMSKQDTDGGGYALTLAPVSIVRPDRRIRTTTILRAASALLLAGTEDTIHTDDRDDGHVAPTLPLSGCFFFFMTSTVVKCVCSFGAKMHFRSGDDNLCVLFDVHGNPHRLPVASVQEAFDSSYEAVYRAKPERHRVPV